MDKAQFIINSLVALLAVFFVGASLVTFARAYRKWKRDGGAFVNPVKAYRDRKAFWARFTALFSVLALCVGCEQEVVVEPNNIEQTEPAPEEPAPVPVHAPDCNSCLDFVLGSADASLQICAGALVEYANFHSCVCEGICALVCGQSTYCGGVATSIECDTCMVGNPSGCAVEFSACCGN